MNINIKLHKNDLPDEYTEFWRDNIEHYEQKIQEEENSEGFLDKIKLF